jgi:hypothetical protein
MRQNRKTTDNTFRFEKEYLFVDDGIPNKVVTFKFHRHSFDRRARRRNQGAQAGLPLRVIRSLRSNTFAKTF